jgi:hypothetical protein
VLWDSYTSAGSFSSLQVVQNGMRLLTGVTLCLENQGLFYKLALYTKDSNCKIINFLNKEIISRNFGAKILNVHKWCPVFSPAIVSLLLLSGPSLGCPWAGPLASYSHASNTCIKTNTSKEIYANHYLGLKE